MKKLIFILQIFLFLAFSYAYITSKDLLFLFLLIPVHFFHISVLLADFRLSDELTNWQKYYLVALMGAGMSSFTPVWDICFGLVAIFVTFLSARELYLMMPQNRQNL